MIKLFLPVLHFSDDSNKFSQVERLQGQPSHLKNLLFLQSSIDIHGCSKGFFFSVIIIIQFPHFKILWKLMWGRDAFSTSVPSSFRYSYSIIKPEQYWKSSKMYGKDNLWAEFWIIDTKLSSGNRFVLDWTDRLFSQNDRYLVNMLV